MMEGIWYVMSVIGWGLLSIVYGYCLAFVISAGIMQGRFHGMWKNHQEALGRMTATQIEEIRKALNKLENKENNNEAKL